MRNLEKYSQSFTKKELYKILEKRDIDTNKDRQSKKDAVVLDAISDVERLFKANPLSPSRLEKKAIYNVKEMHHKLIVRKLQNNIRHTQVLNIINRTEIISSLKNLAEEELPYRFYKFDIKNFYESIDGKLILKIIGELKNLTNLSKLLIKKILSYHGEMGGSGLPRGLSLSAALSELLMKPFDLTVVKDPRVFFYARFVDDIVLVTSGMECERDIFKFVKAELPNGLLLNKSKCKYVTIKENKDKKYDETINYLGYSIRIAEIAAKLQGKQAKNEKTVVIDISNVKIRRFKTRITRSLISFGGDGDWNLLRDRIKFLTRTFVLINKNTGKKKIAGLYQSYPMINGTSKALLSLDVYLRRVLSEKRSRLYKRSKFTLTAVQKKKLSYPGFVKSYASGEKSENFINFPSGRMALIQKCWKG